MYITSPGSFFQAKDGIREIGVTGVQTCALPIFLLREDVDNLGARGEIVKVKAGFARNYLLPRRLAVEATAGNVRQIEAERAALLKKEARERATDRKSVV